MGYWPDGDRRNISFEEMDALTRGVEAFRRLRGSSVVLRVSVDNMAVVMRKTEERRVSRRWIMALTVG
jgi:hypothetical protein